LNLIIQTPGLTHLNGKRKQINQEMIRLLKEATEFMAQNIGYPDPASYLTDYIQTYEQRSKVRTSVELVQQTIKRQSRLKAIRKWQAEHEDLFSNLKEPPITWSWEKEAKNSN
jgi:hypothetical protein